MRDDLRRACESLATPLRDALPALAPGQDARRAQLGERAWWMQFSLAADGLSAAQCARYLELLALIDAHNAAAKRAAEGWPQ